MSRSLTHKNNTWKAIHNQKGQNVQRRFHEGTLTKGDMHKVGPALSLNSSPQQVNQVQASVLIGEANQRGANFRDSTGYKAGLPGNLKISIESLSGLSMNDVLVHYNSEKPAQTNTLAYAYGSQIYLGAGQEKHLPHEAWHVVQQKQGRVKPT